MKGKHTHEHHHHGEHEVHHHHYKKGGSVGGPTPHEMVYAGQGSNVEHEAEEKKKGGKVKKHHRAHGGHVEGHKPKHHRLDRPGRKRGGGVGSDMSPLSSAARTKDAGSHKATEGDALEGP